VSAYAAPEPFVRAAVLRRERVPDFERYPFSLPAVRNLVELDLSTPVTVLVGENASGKSTLTEAIAVAAGLNAEGGGANFAFSTRRSHSDLHEYLTLTRGARRPRTSYFLRAESFFNVASEIERLDEGPGGSRIIDAYGGRSLHEQSHGESFLSLIVNRFGPNGFYILDEPEAALSVRGQLALIRRIHELVGEGSQFIIATHSPILVAYPDARVLALSDDGFQTVDYRDTDPYELTRSFLESPERFLRHLLGD
jgi:predicted ATPase